MAVKALWRDAWSFEHLVERLRRTPDPLAPLGPILSQSPDRESASGSLLEEVRGVLGPDVGAVLTADAGVSGVVFTGVPGAGR